MDVLIAVCAGLIAGFLIGFIIAWRKQKKKLEPGFNKWKKMKALNEYGNRLTADVIDTEPINGTNKVRITAEYYNPITNARYTFQQTFSVKDKSPTFIQRLHRLATVKVLVHPDTAPPNHLFWMERPW